MTIYLVHTILISNKYTILVCEPAHAIKTHHVKKHFHLNTYKYVTWNLEEKINSIFDLYIYLLKDF
jgi:hypothetical protein